MNKKLKEGIDYYIDENTGYVVFTSLFLQNRGICCGNGCKNCCYEPMHTKGNKILKIKNKVEKTK